MDLLQGILSVLSPLNLLYCFAGCVLGTLVGVLPGLGPASTMSILLPITTFLDPTGAIIMLCGLYYGAAYGGSTTSILVNIPGEVSSVATCFDGFPMAQKGNAGQALWIAAVGSCVAGTLGTVLLSVVGPGVARLALKFGPAEYTGLLVLSLMTMVSMSGASITRGLGAGVVGMIIATAGIDPLTGLNRFSYGSTAMMRGFEIIPIAVGLFGIAEILLNLEAGISRVFQGKTKLGRMTPPWPELKKGLKASLRGTLLGLPLGILPGMVPALSSFLAYDLEKKLSKYPEKFGTGVIEGVAAPEAANNATAQSGFLPLMAFGIPTGPSMAIILAALMMYGLQPGPVLFQVKKEFVWTVIGSMYIGNVMLLLLNLPLVGMWARISLIPYKYLGPTILGICVVGAYSPRNTMFDVWIALAAGILGYAMRKTGWPPAPLILGFILGPMFETSLRQSLSMGGPAIFLQRPIAAGFLILSVVMIIVSVKLLKRVPKEALEDDDGK